MFSRVLVFASCLLLPLDGAEIAWRSTLFETNETSQGESLTSAWSFHLGYFEAGFAPSSNNTSQWCEHWTTVDVASYNDSSARFAGLWEDDGSVPDGSKGYIWGFNRGSASPEWVLMSASDWTWPLPTSSPLDPFAGEVLWEVEAANQVIVGQANQSDTHLKTASVSGQPPLLDGDSWLSLFFTANELQNPNLSGWTADPDGDGVTNLEEFAFATHPRESDSPEMTATVASGFLEVTVGTAEKVGVVFVGQVSSDLEIWEEGSLNIPIVGATSQSMTFRDLTPTSAASRRFGRVKVTLAP